jgi:putative toxin-antitoxin system antitoxin component (TIGR02293 family)
VDKFPNEVKSKKNNKNTKPPHVNEPALVYLKPESPVFIHSILSIDLNRVAEPLSRVDTFRRGLRKKSFEKLKEVTGLDYATLATVLAVSSKTLQRKQVFDVVQSEKMYELAELYALGISYFGEEGFKRWMERPLFRIGNRKTIELLAVSEVMSLLKTEIMRMQHGIAI